MMRWVVCAMALALASSAVAQTTTQVVSIGFSNIPPSMTTAGLPVCGAATTGSVYRVTDALLPTLGVAVTGGGAVSVVVRCNGTAWLVGQ